MPRATDVKKCFDAQHWIDGDVTNPALLPRQLQRMGIVRAPERPGVFPLPDVRVLLRVSLLIELALLIENVGEPWIVAPVRLNNNRVSRLFYSQKLINGVALPARVPVCPELRSSDANGWAKQREAAMAECLGLLYPSNPAT
jgi:hypothetical protein